jgi:hypothetical protein
MEKRRKVLLPPQQKPTRIVTLQLLSEADTVYIVPRAVSDPPSLLDS